jgi:hypothetical protein
MCLFWNKCSQRSALLLPKGVLGRRWLLKTGRAPVPPGGGKSTARATNPEPRHERRRGAEKHSAVRSALSSAQKSVRTGPWHPHQCLNATGLCTRPFARRPAYRCWARPLSLAPHGSRSSWTAKASVVACACATVRCTAGMSCSRIYTTAKLFVFEEEAPAAYDTHCAIWNALRIGDDQSCGRHRDGLPHGALTTFSRRGANHRASHSQRLEKQHDVAPRAAWRRLPCVHQALRQRWRSQRR